ncbi:MAG: hypothetical protein ACI9MC_003507 [Kiritimatiellia bacterium]|jgi:hypothetical protein
MPGTFDGVGMNDETHRFGGRSRGARGRDLDEEGQIRLTVPADERVEHAVVSQYG